MNYRERVGKNINHYRKVNDLTLKEVANRVGITEATMQKYEVGQIKRVDIEMIEKIANAIGTTASKLTGWLNREEEEEAHIARVNIHKANADAIGGLTKSEVELIKEHRKLKAKSKSVTPSISFGEIQIKEQSKNDEFFESLPEKDKEFIIDLYRKYQDADDAHRLAVYSLLKEK